MCLSGCTVILNQRAQSRYEGGVVRDPLIGIHVVLYTATSLCGRQGNNTQVYPGLNPWGLGICHVTSKRNEGCIGGISQSTLRWSYLGGSNASQVSLVRKREGEGEELEPKEWYH